MTSLKFKLKNYWSSWGFTFMMFKSSWKLVFIQIFAPNGFLVCDRLRSNGYATLIIHEYDGWKSLRIQTGKYENRGALIPVEGRTSLVCNRGYKEDKRHFLMYCPGYDNIRNELRSLLVFKRLIDEDKIRYLLTLENKTTSKIVGKRREKPS